MGLTSDEVRERKSKGQVNKVRLKVSRTYSDIIIKNVFTPFNIMLFIVGGVLLGLQQWTNALSATIFIILNIVVATIQEIRAKRKLDKIAMALRPKVTVVRDGKEVTIEQDEIVKDDVIVIVPGDQILVDGELLEAKYLEMDESPLTGESSTVMKRGGQMVFSGTYCITGKGYYRATGFGEDSYFYKMISSARRYKNKFTPLQLETTSVIKIHVITCFLFLIIEAVNITILLWNHSFTEAINVGANTAVIIIDIVPMALPLFVTISYMVAAVRMANGGVLLQKTNAVESLSHVNTVCMDKTGTLTTNKLLFSEYTKFKDNADELIKLYLGATGSKNKTVEALIDHFGTEECVVIDEIRFSSERKYSAVKLEKDGKRITMYLGALNVIEHRLKTDLSDVVKEYSKKGLRCVILTECDDVEFYKGNIINMPELRPVAVLALADEIRKNCRETLDVFFKNNMDVKVISGDDPLTITSLFDLAQIPGEKKVITGDELDALSGAKKKKAILNSNIFGRMKPEQKENVIETLKNNGRYIAMVGDGVNDVKSLKMAHVGIALQSGANAAKGASELVLVNDDFAALPNVLVEGRKTLAGMRDALKIFLTKNVTIAFLTLFVIVIMLWIFAKPMTPLLPTQQMIYAFLTVTIASFFIIVWAQPNESKKSVMPGVLNYVIPTALTASIFAVVIYLLFYNLTLSGNLDIPFSIDAHDKWLTYGFPQFNNWNELVAFYGGEEKINFIQMGAEINARCALLMFVIIEGVIQLFMIVPRWKFLSLDGRVNKDNRPFILAIIMCLLTVLVYYLASQGMMENFFPTVVFDWNFTLMIMGFAALWFVANLFLLRNNHLHFITRMFERGFQRMLAETYKTSAKEDDEEVGSAEKLK